MTAPLRILDGRVVPLSGEEIAGWDASVAMPAPARYIAKTAIIRRATDAEVAAFEAWLADTATHRQRALWRDAAGGLVGVADVLPLAEALFGAERAAELLAP